MNRLLLLPFVVLAIVGPAEAATTFPVSITKTGFAPSAVTIAEGDSVTWTNADMSNHQVVSKAAGFASPILKPGESYSFLFKTQGRYVYEDPIPKKKSRGTVTVTATPQSAASVTARASRSIVVYGSSLTLSGTVSNARSGETVTILAQRYGQVAPTPLGSAISASGGAWSFLVKPTLRTSYEAQWKPQGGPAVKSGAIAVNVRPRIGWRVKAAIGRLVTFFTRASGARSFAGRFVYLQRRNAFGQWVSLRRVYLGASSSATFKARLPRGRSRVRLFMPARQAGAGYIAGISRTLTLFR